MTDRLKDYIDTNMLQKLQDGFANVTGMSAVTYCESGFITRISNPSEFSVKYSKDSALGGQDNIPNAKIIKSGRPSVYYTKSGLSEIGVAIVINGKQLATIVAGQVLDDQINESKAKRIADDLGFNSADFINDLKNVKVISKNKITSASDFLYTIVQMISSSTKAAPSLPSYQEMTFSGDMDSTAGLLYKKLGEIDELIQLNSINNRKLYDSYTTLGTIAQNSVKKVADTKDTVKSIQDIAMNTRILGFNASIEASRAKESGKGFGVIAQEVRTLADVSKSSTDKIDSIIQEIGTNTEEIAENVRKTETILHNNLDNSDNMVQLLNEISSLAGQLK